MSRSDRRPTCFVIAAGAAVILVTVATPPAPAQTQFPAALAGHATLPAATFVAAPSNAPDSLKVSGKYTTPDARRRDTPASMPGTSFLSDRNAPRATGLSLPFAAGQPVQGFSGIKASKDGTFWVLTDNGFGNKRNSPDAMLMFHRVRIDWTRGTVDRVETIFLRDPDRVIPFHVVNEATRERYLTGSDLDIESIQPIGDAFYFGDEFGPYLIRTDRTGKVTGFWETTLDGKVLRSPDHFGVSTPATRAHSRRRCGARVATRAWPPRRTAASSTRCSRDRSGMIRRRRGSRGTGANTCASSSSTWHRRGSRGARGSTSSRSMTTTSATST